MVFLAPVTCSQFPEVVKFDVLGVGFISKLHRLHIFSMFDVWFVYCGGARMSKEYSEPKTQVIAETDSYLAWRADDIWF